ncbi:hypothetical protein KCH_57480 [Kitasatospora cheerisanensis KCTC 2395]|uniref:Uncharacterized protein n=1 Tax=Kitasatospora cheerisanensis KCTC 2395 TaxID=1348663 RepID=A0A066YXA2_9ACTN|nr:hypothetical protein KCH_57480 [Kitasatospora cheerisanensis KCTC 2395]
MQDDQDQGGEDEDRDDGVEGLAGEHDQQGGAGESADQRGGAVAEQSASLAGEFGAVADGAGERAGGEAEGVRDVGGDGGRPMASRTGKVIRVPEPTMALIVPAAVPASRTASASQSVICFPLVDCCRAG